MLLLSTDSLPGYGIDHLFGLAKDIGFEGIDLVTRKSFDVWNPEYIKKLSQKYELPIKIVQVSNKVNKKELDLALKLCGETGADTITINAPRFFDLKTFEFLNKNLDVYKQANPHINFSIINPPDSNIFALPIPKYRFSNISEIIKKYGCYLALDIANFDESLLEDEFFDKLEKFVPYISVVYLTDKNRSGKKHLLPGEGVLKIPQLLKKLKKLKYQHYFSLKFTPDKKDLADSDKMKILLEKGKKYYQEKFIDLKLD